MAKKSRREIRLELETRKQRRNQTLLVAGLVVAAAVVAVVVLLARSSPEQVSNDEPRLLSDVPPAERNGYYSEPPAMAIDISDTFTAVIRTDNGDISIRLFAEESPITVNNFVALARDGFYDGLTFHRVMKDFMAQGGDPTGIGSGGPGYQFEDETNNGLVFDRPGLLAMANRGPNTNGSQFFITYVPALHLNGAHTIFGELIGGEDVLNTLTEVIPDGQTPSGGDVINRVDIIVE